MKNEYNGTRPVFLCAAALLTAVAGAWGAEGGSLQLQLERASAADGPWTKPIASEVMVFPDGSIEALNTGKDQFFRLTLGATGTNDSHSPWITLAAAPPLAVQIASDHLRQGAGARPGGTNTVRDDDERNWRSATLGPVALKVYDPAYKGGQEPAYIEFKVVPVLSTPPPGMFGTAPVPESNLGHILVSLNEEDVPVSEWSTGGLTPGEQLLSAVGTRGGAKLLKFGAGFAAVEGTNGALLVSEGPEPVKLPASLLTYLGQAFTGFYDTDTGTNPPAAGPRLPLAPYSSYAEFKMDYVNGPVYQELRRRRAQAVRGEWELIHGRPVAPPAIVTADFGKTTNLFAGQAIVRFLLEEEDADSPLATIATNRAGGGIRVTGLRPGSALLRVQTATTREKVWLKILSPFAPGLVAPQSLQSFTPGWQPPRDWYAGTYADQPRYKTIVHGDYCPKVGCGPVAWAMILAWWDRQGVPAAFASWYPNRVVSLQTIDAPMSMDIETNPDGHARVSPLYRDLHEYCDVLCSPSGEGATPPGDMVEALCPQTFFERAAGYLGMSYGYAWDLADPDWNTPSSYCRRSIKNNRVSVLGLGWMTHYVLAYGYRYEEYKVDPNIPPLFVRRSFKCNTGFAKSSGYWKSGYDTFLATDLTFWNK